MRRFNGAARLVQRGGIMLIASPSSLAALVTIDDFITGQTILAAAGRDRRAGQKKARVETLTAIAAKACLPQQAGGRAVNLDQSGVHLFD